MLVKPSLLLIRDNAVQMMYENIPTALLVSLLEPFGICLWRA